MTFGRWIPFVLLTVFLSASAPESGVCETSREAHTVSVNGIDLYYETMGEGDPLVLLHSGTQIGRMYDPFVEEFAKHYRLIIPDLRGHGGSTNPGGEFRMRQFALDILALLDELGIDRFKAVGASAGALTVLHMATLEPDRVEAMVLVGAGMYLPQDCRETISQWTADTYPESGWNRMRQWHRHGDEQIRALFDMLAQMAADYEDPAFTPPCLSTITARTLIVHGDRDYCFPASMAVEMYESIPRAYLWILPNAGHVPIFGPVVPLFTETVLAFLGGSWEKP
jgi:pimeloyl-ACP methyl ester carboxylesterase